MRKEDNSIITLRPSIGQYFINELPLLLLCVAMLLMGGLPDCAYSTLLLVLSLLFSLCLLYRFIYLRSIRYHIGSEQLICEHGVFQRSVNYMELYRVVDFAEHQTLMQQLCGLKSVTMLSMDRTTPKLDMTGISKSYDVVSVIRTRVETNKRIDKIWIVVVAFVLSVPSAHAQIVTANPLEWMALAEGNEAINGEIEKEIKGQTKTALLQNTIAAEFTKIHEWEKKYNSYLKTASGYASSLKACTYLYDDGVKIFITLGKMRKAISNNPQGIVATLSMNNLYMETATELVSVFTLLKDAVAKGGTENMLTGAERSKTLWALNDKLSAFSKKLHRLYLSIRYYTMTDVWNSVTAGMIYRSNGEIATQALGRWRRAGRMTIND
jgi:hypothetical protein